MVALITFSGKMRHFNVIMLILRPIRTVAQVARAVYRRAVRRMLAAPISPSTPGAMNA